MRIIRSEDLDKLFEFQTDVEVNYLAAFTAPNSDDKWAYFEKWSKLLLDSKVNLRTIFYESQIAGSVAKYEMDGKPEITYWIGKAFWGKGIATTALRQFLEIEKSRPVYGRVAFDNLRSIKVLENCGFQKIRTAKGFANARVKEILEYVYELSA